MDTQLKIKGMSCQHCVKAVDGALRTLPGIEVVEVSVGEARISSDGPVDMATIKATIEDLGFEMA